MSIQQLENELLGAADQLRANSNITVAVLDADTRADFPASSDNSSAEVSPN
ncbi:hypothetical protein JJD84_11925 [Pseudomonas fluorescens]|nr:hypothetical protein [Pseudomonas fluorescens]